MTKILGSDGKPVGLDPAQRINGLIASVERSLRKGETDVLSVLAEVLRSGWEIAHDPSLPAMKVMAITVNRFQRDMNGALKMDQRGIVACGDSYLPAINSIQALNEKEASKEIN